MPDNFYMFFLAGLIPLIVGAIYYSPAVAGKAWMKVNGFTEESLKGGNMLLIFGLTYVLSVLISFIMSSIVIHQGGVFSMMYPEILEAGSATANHFNELMQQYGHKSRSFGHGVIHGVMISIFFVLPIIAINALFERRGAKYIFIHWFYWLICLVLIGGVICKTLSYSPLP